MLPDAGPLSAEFRQRVKYAVYLIIVSAIFGMFAIVIGLPTLIIRPSKFVICMTLSTLSAAASMIVLQKPSVFLSNLLKEPIKSGPIVSLLVTMLLTGYITIFVNRYLLVLLAAGAQVICMLWYLSSYVPGGQTGLKMLLKATYVLVSTALMPCIYLCKRQIVSLWR